MRGFMLTVLLVTTAFFLIGCGETLSGAGKDINRMGKGFSTFFFRQP